MKNYTFRGSDPTRNSADAYLRTNVPAHGRVVFDVNGNPSGASRYETYVPFSKVTLASAATTVAQLYTNNWQFIHSGTGTEVVAQSDSGGTNYKSQATTPADGDNVLITPVAAATSFYAKLLAQAQWRLETQVSLNTIATVFASFGFDENITDVDPTGTAGDGARFLFDPTGEVTTGLATATRANWILAHKVDGADTFADTGIVVTAGKDYELVIEFGTDLKAKFYIDGVYVGQGPALTSGDTVAVFSGLELTATPDGQQDMDIRYVSLSRVIG